ncbi:MAG: hypothetical protein M3P01_03560 [Actinomycetota bacterium]|nr:hypothetical protein [Actinomycetota bacterium]
MPPDDVPDDQAKAWRNAARGHATRGILNDEELRRLLESLRERYGSALDTAEDPTASGGAFDSR